MKKTIKKLRSAKTKRKIKYLARHPFVVPVTTFVVLFMVSLFGLVVAGAQTAGPTDSRVVQVHVDGQTQVVPTRANTVADLLDRLAIEVEDKDIVEPSLTAEITDDNFQINVYKARRVLIEDEGKQVVTRTAAPTPKAAAEAAGLKIYPEDIIEQRAIDTIEPLDAIKEGVISERIVIERSIPIDINIYGKQLNLRTHADTVDDLLRERNLGDVTVLPARTAKITPNLSVFVTEPGKKLRVAEEEIPFEEESREDPNLEFGQERIEQEGVVGKRAVVYEISKDGTESIFNQVTVRNPQKQIVVRGTKPPTVVVAGSHGQLMAQAGIPASEHGAAEFIIGRESGWRLNARNASGCLGLGQACPGSKLINACPNYATDPVCQLRFFSGYVNGRYGGWNGAYSFWAVNHWY